MQRILGVPGDRIEFKNGAISVNGKPLETGAVDVAFTDDRGHTLDTYEQRIDSHVWPILDDRLLPALEPPPVTVPPGRYFMLGDNRDHSKDSRLWGTVARSELLGPVTQIYWSWDFNGTWVELLRPQLWWDLLFTKTRWDRIGLAVQ